jgi:hypothetical protein
MPGKIVMHCKIRNFVQERKKKRHVSCVCLIAAWALKPDGGFMRQTTLEKVATNKKKKKKRKRITLGKSEIAGRCRMRMKKDPERYTVYLERARERSRKRPELKNQNANISA